VKQWSKILVAGALLSLAVSGATTAGPLDKAQAAFERRDFATAMRLFRPFAEQGNAHAQFVLGYMYAEGHGVPKNGALAIAWGRKAAEQGDIGAQALLGGMYYFGDGVPRDYAQAYMWVGRAAERGDSFSQNILGAMYLFGDGVPQDYVQAHMWFNLSASRLSDEAMRATAIKYRDEIAAKMTPEQLAEAQKMAREWVPK
jgi:uncharacterized protein